MMLHELCTGEYTTYTVINRVPKDDYIKRKIQKDRNKLMKWMNALLKNREVILFYKQDDVEKMSIVSLIEIFGTMPDDIPMNVEIVNNKEVLEMQHFVMYERPSREQIVIHADQITKFIVRTEGLSELHKTIRWYAD